MKYGIICCSAWDDPKFCSLSASGMLSVIFIWTHQRRNSCGIYRDTPQSLAALNPRPEDEFLAGFQEGIDRGFIFYDSVKKIILIHNYVKHCQPGNPNIMKSWIPVIKTIPDCDLKEKWRQETITGLDREGYRELFEQLFPQSFAPAPEAIKPELPKVKAIIPPAEIAQELLPAIIQPKALTVKEPKIKRPKAPKLSDEEFLQSLRSNTAFRHIDIDRELALMDSWLLAHPGRVKTRQFIVNWLGRSVTSNSPVTTNQNKPYANKLTGQGQRNAALVNSMLSKDPSEEDE